MQRSDRVGDEIQRVLADIIHNEIKDPRLPSMVSVVDVRASRDLSHAHVYISVMGDDQARKDCAAALRAARGFIRRELTGRMRLRVSPELHFVLDDSIERGIRMTQLIDQAVGRRPAADEAGSDDAGLESADGSGGRADHE